MTTYTSVFGNETVPPSDYSLREFSLTANTTLYWPDNNDGPDLAANTMSVTPSGGAWVLTLPAANQVSTGRDLLIRNLGAVSFTVNDNVGGAIATLAAGEVKLFQLTNNSTVAGTWTVFTYGTGTSSADASLLAGNGLTVVGGQLVTDLTTLPYGAGYTVTEATDSSSMLLYPGGTTTWYLPDPTTVSNGFFFAIKNGGTGSLTIDASTNSGTLDSSTLLMLQPSDSCFIVRGNASDDWYSVGYGRSNTFEFTQLSVDVTGTGGITITSAQAANKLWYFYNTAGGDRTVTIPAVASVYFVRVGAIGAGNDLTFTTGSGSTVSLSANQSYTIYCDGTNVVSAQTVAVTSNVSLDDGSAASPALAFSLDTDTGVYRAGANTLGVSAAGAMVATFGASGMTLANALPVTSGGTGVTTSTGTGAVVRAVSPALTTPDLGTPSALVGTNITGTANGLTAGALVGVSAAQVAAVAAIDDEVVAVAGNAANITTVATNISNVNTVAGIAANVTTVAGISANVTSVAGNAANINTCATNMADIQAAPQAAIDAEAAWDSFDDRYLGPKASDPTLDNDGNALLEGALYWNTTSKGMKIYNGTGWVPAAGVVSPDFTILRETATATAGQTVFDLTNTYVVGTNAIMVYQNGSRLLGTDYTETDSNTITLATGATVGDELLFEIGVVATGTSVAAGNVTFSPAGSIAATNVQAALQELDTEKGGVGSANSWTAQQTFKELKDTIHTITDGAAFEIDPANGAVQIVTLGASRTPAATNFEAGQTVLLGIDDGTAYAITWTTVAPTWVKAGGSGAAPTLATSGFTWVLLWKVSTTMYAAVVGSP